MTGGPDAVVRAGAERFLAHELTGTDLARAASGHAAAQAGALIPVDIAAIGTTAPAAVTGALLDHALRAAGFVRRGALVPEGPDELLAAPGWRLGVVLSPWKRKVGARCTRRAPSAEATGVVDTVVRGPAGTVGFNTNTWAAQCAIEVLSGAAAPRRALILGAGASSRSVVLALRRVWPACEVVIFARSAGSAEELAAVLGGRPFVEPRDRTPGSGGFDLVVNTTTWGETEASEQQPFALDLAGFLVPGVRLFDLNNRIGALAHQALAAGCAVVSGAVMQRVTNACRAALLAPPDDGGAITPTCPPRRDGPA